MGSGRRGILVAVMALVLAVNNGAFAALAFVGINTQSNAIAASTPAVSLDQSTTKYVPPTSTYPSHTYQNGDLNANNSAYREGDCVPFRVQLTNLDPSATTTESLLIQYEHFRAGNYGYMSVQNFAVDLGSDGSIDLTPTVTGVQNPLDTDATQTVTVTFSTGGATSATLYYCGVLAVPTNGHGGISSISGAPVHMRVISGMENGTTYSIGNQDRSIQPAAVQPFGVLTITKSSSTIVVGGLASYTITVSNTGAGSATGVIVTDTLPAGTWTVSSSQGSCAAFPCTLGTIAAGGSATITVSRLTTVNDCGTLTNTASATSTNSGSAGPATGVVTVNCPNVSVLKTGSAAVSAGGTATFTIVVTAGGTGASTNVTLSDTLPAGTWTLGGADAASCSITSGVLACSFGTMANASTRTVTLSRATTAADCNGLSNTATVSAAVDASTANNSSTASITVNCGNIALAKTADAASVTAGSPIGYTITATNNGAGSATTVTVTDTLPTTAGTSWSIDAAGSTAGCTITTGVLTCNFGTLAPTASAHVHLTSPTTLASCGTVSNSASVSTGNDGTANAGPTTITVNCPNVSVVKTAGPAISSGSTATFTIVVTAGGTGASTLVMLTDTLAAGHTWTLGGASAESCSITSGVLSCNFGTMTNGSTRTITLSTTATSTDCSEGLSNTATLSAAVDANLANNSSTATQTVNCGQISLTKTADAATVASGISIGFLITVTNNGAGTATSTTVSDTLPTTAGTSWTIDAAGSDAGCSIASGILTCNFGDLASNASKHVHLTSPTTTASCGTVSNTATVRTGNDGTSTATASVTVTCPPPPALGGILVTKYNDANRNGTRDAGEATLSGFVFTVKIGGATVTTITSDANGTAAVVNLSAGTYTVTETQQTGWTSTDPGTSLTKTASVSVGQTTTVLFGNAAVQLPPTSAGTLVVTKYNDLNANKTRDTNEPALAGWTFTVKDASGATVGSVATDANGNAIFSNVAFGTYTVTETLQAGWTSTDPGGATPTKTVTINAANTTVLFGNAQIKLPNTSTAEAPASPSPAILFLLGVLLLQGLLITLVFRRWRND